MPDSQYFRTQAARCRNLAAEAVKWTIRQGLLDMAEDFERVASEMDAENSEIASQSQVTTPNPNLLR
jgi:hypothetical protein